MANFRLNTITLIPPQALIEVDAQPLASVLQATNWVAILRVAMLITTASKGGHMIFILQGTGSLSGMSNLTCRCSQMVASAKEILDGKCRCKKMSGVAKWHERGSCASTKRCFFFSNVLYVFKTGVCFVHLWNSLGIGPFLIELCCQMKLQFVSRVPPLSVEQSASTPIMQRFFFGVSNRCVAKMQVRGIDGSTSTRMNRCFYKNENVISDAGNVIGVLVWIWQKKHTQRPWVRACAWRSAYI